MLQEHPEALPSSLHYIPRRKHLLLPRENLREALALQRA